MTLAIAAVASWYAVRPVNSDVMERTPGMRLIMMLPVV